MNFYTRVMTALAMALLLPARLLRVGATDWLRSFDWSAVKDKKAYAKFLSRIIAALAVVCFLSALLSFFSVFLAVLELLLGIFAVFRYSSMAAGEYYR